MKKVFAFALALVLIATLSLVSFAAATPGEENSADNPLTVTYTGYKEADVVYSLDVAFTDTAFTYNGGSQGTWDAAKHEYTGAVAAGWSGQATVTITNHSNAGVVAATTITPEEETSYVFAAVENVTLGSAAAENKATTATIKIDPPTSGVPTESGTIAKVTIAFSAAA